MTFPRYEGSVAVWRCGGIAEGAKNRPPVRHTVDEDQARIRKMHTLKSHFLHFGVQSATFAPIAAFSAWNCGTAK